MSTAIFFLLHFLGKFLTVVELARYSGGLLYFVVGRRGKEDRRK